MRAIAITEFGGADRRRPTDAPDPLVGPGSVLVRSRTAGINPVDYKVFVRPDAAGLRVLAALCDAGAVRCT